MPELPQDRRSGDDWRHHRRRRTNASAAELRELHVEASEHSTGGRRVVEQLAEAGFAIAARHVHGETMDLTFART